MLAFIGKLHQARAESALRALGKAYQDQYDAIKRLPPGSTAKDVDRINRSTFAHANELMVKETNAKQARLNRALLNIKKELEATMNESKKDKAAAKAKKMTVAQYRKSIGKPERRIARAGAAASAGAGVDAKDVRRPSGAGQQGLGNNTGYDGAKPVDFGDGKPANDAPKYKVIDGIIQE